MSDTPITMQTPAAILAPKQQYLNLLMNSVYKFSEICAAPVPSTEAKNRVSMMVRMMIAYIPSEEEREKLYAYRDSEINSFKKKSGDATQLMDFTFTLDCRIVGKIMSLMDQLLAITDRQVIMMSGGNYDELENKYFPNGVKVEQVQEEEGE